MCPTCGRGLDFSNHVQGTLIQAGEQESVVELLFACRGCLSILRAVQRHRVEGARTDSAVTCAIPGARSHREIERLRDASPEDRLRVFEEIAGDPERRFLLRVPEAFQTVRALYRDHVRLLDDAICGWRPADDGQSIPWPPLIRWSLFGREVARVGRLLANPFDEGHRRAARERAAPVRIEVGGDRFLLLPEGTRLAIHQTAKNVLLLLGPSGERMAAAPDICVPDVA